MNDQGTVSCDICGAQTSMIGTKHCDRCYELERRVKADPKLTHLILGRMREEASKLAFSDALPIVEISIGKTFVYRNNCRSLPAAGERWDEFRKLLAVVPDEATATLIYERCSLTHMGEAILSIEHDLFMDLPIERVGWVECSESEYAAARARVVVEIHYPTAMVAYFSKMGDQ